jgi:hypothetical protein
VGSEATSITIGSISSSIVARQYDEEGVVRLFQQSIPGVSTSGPIQSLTPGLEVVQNNGVTQIRITALDALAVSGGIGATGASGGQGATGPEGPAGKDGTNGTGTGSGVSSSGATGETGPTGETGATGTAGSSGPTGGRVYGATGMTTGVKDFSPTGTTGAIGPNRSLATGLQVLVQQAAGILALRDHRSRFNRNQNTGQPAMGTGPTGSLGRLEIGASGVPEPQGKW